MPQLDFFSISNQFFWGIIYFSVFYFFVSYFVVPTLFVSIFAREYFTKISGSDNSDNVFFTQFALSVANGYKLTCQDLLVNSADDLGFVNFSVFAAVSEFINFEINNFSSSQSSFETYDSKLHF